MHWSLNGGLFVSGIRMVQKCLTELDSDEKDKKNFQSLDGSKILKQVNHCLYLTVIQARQNLRYCLAT